MLLLPESLLRLLILLRLEPSAGRSLGLKATARRRLSLEPTTCRRLRLKSTAMLLEAARMGRRRLRKPSRLMLLLLLMVLLKATRCARRLCKVSSRLKRSARAGRLGHGQLLLLLGLLAKQARVDVRSRVGPRHAWRRLRHGLCGAGLGPRAARRLGPGL